MMDFEKHADWLRFKVDSLLFEHLVCAKERNFRIAIELENLIAGLRLDIRHLVDASRKQKEFSYMDLVDE